MAGADWAATGESLVNIGTGLFGSSGSQETNSKLNEILNQLTTVSQNTEMSRAEKETSINELMSAMEQTISSNSQSLSDLQIQQTEAQLGIITGALNDAISTDYSADAAKQVSAQARDAAITEILRQGMGEVLNIGTSAGAYDSTVQKEGATELAARAAEKGAATELNTVQQYAALQGQKTATLAGTMGSLLDILKGSKETTAQDLSQKTDQTNTGTSAVTGTQSSDTNTTTETESTRDSTSVATTESEQDGLLDNLGVDGGDVKDASLTIATGGLNKVFGF